MSYTGQFITAYGDACIIRGTTPVSTYVCLSQSTRALNDLGIREAAYEGLILSDSGLESGDVFDIDTVAYLTLSTSYRRMMDELAILAIRSNATINQKRETGSTVNNNVVYNFNTLNRTVPCFLQALTYEMRASNPGYLVETKFLCFLPKNIGVQVMDRITYGYVNYRVVSVDALSVTGISRLQMDNDMRPY